MRVLLVRGGGVRILRCWLPTQRFGVLLVFSLLSFSLLSLLDLESLGILLSLLARLSVLRLSSGGNLVSLGVLSNLDVEVVRSGW